VGTGEGARRCCFQQEEPAAGVRDCCHMHNSAKHGLVALLGPRIDPIIHQHPIGGVQPVTAVLALTCAGNQGQDDCQDCARSCRPHLAVLGRIIGE